MFKQFLSKLPRKSSKSENADPVANSGANCSPAAAAGGGGTAAAAAARSASVKRMSSAVFPASVVAGIEPLLPFKDVPNAEKQNLFLSKLNLCCVVFDFADPNANAEEKDLKRQTLVELVEFVASGSARFGEPVIAGICKMAAVNLFRVFAPSFRSSTPGAETEEEEPIFDPAWSHLQFVYELLLRVVASSSFEAKVAKKYIDHSFILRLLDLFDSEDPRERDCLKTILHRVYGKFMVHRPFIRKAITNIFYRFVFETEKHNGIAELLEILGSVISGFALPLKEEHKMFLWRALIPLHKPKCVGNYLQQLSFCVSQFIEKEPKLASTVIRGLLKYWPVTNSQKEVMFIGELEEVLEATSMAEFQKCMRPLSRRIACCLNSSHFQVAERALFLWNNDHIVSLIAQNRHVILPIIYPALERNMKNHWNQAVLNLTVNVRKMFSEMDESLFQTCQANFEEEEAKLKAEDEKRKLVWERVEAIAGYHPLSGKTAVLVTPLAVASPIVVGGLN